MDEIQRHRRFLGTGICADRDSAGALRLRPRGCEDLAGSLCGDRPYVSCGSGRRRLKGIQPEPIVPGSAVSALLVRGDLQIAATCTTTYVDANQLLACGHPITQFGAVSMPMTKALVLATVPSPLNAFKIVNTTETVGSITDDRHSAVRGSFGQNARMVPITVELRGMTTPRTLHLK